ncbi:MAG TPA: sugar phosphate isomerase/epimerase [Solirubrobacteraceae bacterium]|nr:sugar phosphate isomerase/epimerase [Solirubrobacteraceae bacterium]
MSVRVANAPLSYGAFEMTVGTSFPVPDPVAVLEAIAGAGYAGTDLGPPGYFGEGDVLRERLERTGLDLVGGFVPVAFSRRDEWDAGLAGLGHTLDLFDAAGAEGGLPVLCDAGGPERVANPGRGGDDPSLGLDDAGWQTLAEGVARAADVARERGYEPVFHHHTASYVEAVPEVERFLERTDVPLLLDSAHLTVAGGDPIAALRDWGERIRAIHVKDVRLDVLEGVKADRADSITAWRRGLFCALGDGDVDLDAFIAAVKDGGYDGWVVVEQDRVLEDEAAFAGAAGEQVRNREWLREHAGW